MKPSYSELLKHPCWQEKRLRVLDQAGWKCEQCLATQKNLQVHHRYYISHRLPWEYPDYCFITLCYECHDGIRIATEEAREVGQGMLDEWELGLNIFGDRLYKMALDAVCENPRAYSKLTDEQWQAALDGFDKAFPEYAPKPAIENEATAKVEKEEAPF